MAQNFSLDIVIMMIKEVLKKENKTLKTINKG